MALLHHNGETLEASQQALLLFGAPSSNGSCLHELNDHSAPEREPYLSRMSFCPFVEGVLDCRSTTQDATHCGCSDFDRVYTAANSHVHVHHVIIVIMLSFST